jgi:V8-like Glu-specific endopeptidase
MSGWGPRAGIAAAAAALACALPSTAVASEVEVDASTAAGRAALDRALGYWTGQRMRAARPADVRLGPRGRVTRADAAPRAIDTSASSSSFPGNVHGKVFFTVAGGSDPGDFVCSATAVDSNRHTLVWTAGHCVNDAQFGGGFASNWVFVPGYDEGATPFGKWAAERLFTTAAWADRQEIRQDLGAARLARDAEGRGIQDAVGSRPIEFALPRAQQFTAFGYPAETTLLGPAFDGERLYTCDSAVTGSDNPPGDGPDTMQIDCDMSGGASGGGWVNAAGEVNGVTSYGYTGDFFHLYGPYFGADARALYRDASGSPLLCAGAEVTNLGGAAADDFGGGDGADAFRTTGAADRARGYAGEDTACGGGGGDRLKGGDADDELRGGAGADVLNGGPGFDVCVGGPGLDRGPGCEERRQIP